MNEVNILKSFAILDGDLVLFSDNAQFTILGKNVLTPATATILRTTSFKCFNSGVEPITSGENIFFTYIHGINTGIREYFTDSLTDTKKAQPITQHVSSLIGGEPRIFRCTTNINILLVGSTSDLSKIYTYTWLYQGAEKSQSAWGVWDFSGDPVVDCFFEKSTIYFILNRRDGCYIESIDLGDSYDESINYSLSLDQKSKVIFNRVEDHWEGTNVFDQYNKYDIGIVQGPNSRSPGLLINFEIDPKNPKKIISFDKLSIDESINSVICYEGLYYDTLYQISQIIPKDSNGSPIEDAPFVIMSIEINYIITGDVTYLVEDLRGNKYETNLSYRKIGDKDNVVGFSKPEPGKHYITIRRRNNQFEFYIKRRNHIQQVVKDITFSANYTRNSSRINIS